MNNARQATLFRCRRTLGALQFTLLCLPAIATLVRTAYNSGDSCNAPSLRVSVGDISPVNGRWSERMMKLKAGDVAPDFEVPAVVGDTKTRFRLSNFRGRRHVVLAFYALDWTPT